MSRLLFFPVALLFASLIACGPSVHVDRSSIGPVETNTLHLNDASIWSGLKKRLPIVQLPMRITAFGPDPVHINLDPDEQRLLQGVGNGVAIGLLPDTAEAFHVLWLGGGADWWLTTLTTFDQSGQFLLYKELFIGKCGGPGPCFDCQETLQIDNDLNLLITDTVRACACDTNDIEIPGSCERYVLKRTGSIGPAGAHISDVMKEQLPLAETPKGSVP